jgi:O-antigen/teichoic acid export membrane protein
VITAVLNMAVVPIVLGRVGTGDYGAWATISSVLAVGALADAGLRTEIVRRVGVAHGRGSDAELSRVVHEGVTLLCLGALLICGVGIVGAPVLRGLAFPHGLAGHGAGELDLLIRATLVLLGVSIVGSGAWAALPGLQRGDLVARAEVMALVGGLAVTLTGALAGWGLWALLAGSTAQTATHTLANLTSMRRVLPEVRPRLVAVDRLSARSFLGLSWLALLAQVSDVVDGQWDKLVLSRYAGPDAVASFQVGTLVVMQAKMLAILPLTPLLAAVAELRDGDRSDLRRWVQALTRTSGVVAAVVFSGLTAFGPALCRLWLGDDAGRSGTVARIFALAMAVNVLAAPLVLRAFGEGRHRIAAASSVANIVVNGICSLVLTMQFGLMGALWGSVAGNVAGTAVFFVLIGRGGGPHWPIPAWRSLSIGAGATAAAVWLGSDGIRSWVALTVWGVAFTIAVASTSWWIERRAAVSTRREVHA